MRLSSRCIAFWLLFYIFYLLTAIHNIYTNIHTRTHFFLLNIVSEWVWCVSGKTGNMKPGSCQWTHTTTQCSHPLTIIHSIRGCTFSCFPQFNLLYCGMATRHFNRQCRRLLVYFVQSRTVAVTTTGLRLNRWRSFHFKIVGRFKVFPVLRNHLHLFCFIHMKEYRVKFFACVLQLNA